ncbi:MAG: right-handed parallel beta-helix repeat-containing protein [Chloroherpetonaceae bacterium]|nr:right-handed parallel beta-helix repeat-containing protein [Chloroherpetonaceae bacterium]
MILPLTAVAATLLGAPQEIVITQDTTLDPNATLHARLIIRASNVTIDGNGATLVGPGRAGDLRSFTGNAIEADGCSNVTIRNLKARGWESGLVARNGTGWLIEQCDFSDNYHDPEFGWGNGNRVGGIILTGIHRSVIRNNRANRVWNGLDLSRCDDNQILHNDFSHCSNVCLKMETACRNHVADNNLSYGIRIKPGEVHARDSTGVLLESGSNHNQFFRNDIRYGGDGVFIRVLNNWVSTGNLFVENDCSYANNNCFEAWSPGNTYIRNRANHGSYGFWLGASDQTVLIGNEAAYNGLPTGKHNAPEPDFEHGGIVFVNGPSSHTIVSGNHCHHNNGGGIVLRGDRASKGARWKAFHWIIQNNRLEHNRWGIFAMYADWVHVANNISRDNTEPDQFIEVSRLTRADNPAVKRAPIARLNAPSVAVAGQPVLLDASLSYDPNGLPLTFLWDTGDATRTDPKFTHVFPRPGYYRLGVTVSNGTLADLAYRDLIVVSPSTTEIGTEGHAAEWGFTMEGDARARLIFTDVTDAIVGRMALQFTPQPYPGADVTAVFPAPKSRPFPTKGKTKLTFWMKTENPNPTGFQDPGPVVKLIGDRGTITFTPGKDYNPLRDAGYSEARWTWTRIEIPLTGNTQWTRKVEGSVDLRNLRAISFTFDSWEYAPFTIWLDGLTFE